jgi:formyl-CoA transferase
MFAVYERDVQGSGKGQVIDLSLYEPLFSLLGGQASTYDQLGVIQGRSGNRSANNAPRNAYKTKDGRWVALSAAAPSITRRVLELTGGKEAVNDPRFRTNADRVKHIEEIDGMVGGWIARHTLKEVLDAFEAAEAAIGPVYDIAQIFEDPQYIARESITTVEDEDLGPLRMQNVFPRMLRTPGRIRHAGLRIGRHQGEILDELVARGLSPEIAERLKAKVPNENESD